MIRTFGHFIARKDGQGEHLKIVFSPTSLPIQQRWRNNGLSADFLADYLTTFFPGDDRAVAECHAELKSAVSYVANELLENAMKFSYCPVATRDQYCDVSRGGGGQPVCDQQR